MNEVHEILEQLTKDDYYVTTNNGMKCKIVDINAFIKIKRYIESIEQENKKAKILVESLKLGATLNEEQEKLLDSILFGSGKYE